MYSLISDGKLIAQVAGTFKDAYERAKAESLVDGGWLRGGVKGRCVSVWSGPLAPVRCGEFGEREGKTLEGVCKHVSYACGKTF